MALTKVAPAGIGSTPGTGYVIGDSFLHSTGLNATNAYYTGIVTSQNIRVLGDLQVDGTTTTLDTEVTSVDKLEVEANNTTVGVAITQSGSGDILNLYDGSSEVFSVADGGAVTATGDISVGGDLTLPDAIVHSGDTDTKIRFPATDTVTVETAGSERLRITSGGNVGIGTDNPGDKLSIYTAPNALVFGAKDTTRGNHIFQLLANNPAGDGELRLYKSSATGTHEKTVEIKSTGNSYFTGGSVGIGTVNPPAKLSVGGSVIFGNTTSSGSGGTLRVVESGNSVYIQPGSNTSNDSSCDLIVSSINGATEKLRIDSSGRLLINTNSSTTVWGYGDGSLQLMGDYQGASASFINNEANTNSHAITLAKTRNGSILQNGDTFGAIVFSGDDSNGYHAATRIISNVDGTPSDNVMPGRLSFQTGGTGGGSPTERLRITSDGKIAIGGNYGDTAAFGRQVLISGTVGLNNDSGNIGIGFNRGSSNTYGYIGTGAWAINGLDNDDFGISSGTTGDLVLGTGAGTERFRIFSSGNIKIGTASNPGSKLFFESSSGSAQCIASGGTNNQDLIIGQSSTEFLRIKSTGKVGINDTNPAYSLSIAGTGAVRNEIVCTDNNGAGAGVYFRTMNGGSMVSNATIRTDNTGNFQIFTGTSSDAERLRITSGGDAIFKGKVTLGEDYSGGEVFRVGKTSGSSYSVYHTGGTAHGFIGYADQLVSGGGATDFAIRSTNNLVFATNGANEKLRITSGSEIIATSSADFYSRGFFFNTDGNSSNVQYNVHNVGNLSAAGTRPGYRHIAGMWIVLGTVPCDNTWRTMLTNFSGSSGMLHGYCGDASSRNIFQYQWNVTSPAYGVSPFSQRFNNGSWNTGSVALQIANNGSSYDLQLKATSHYSSSNTASFRIIFNTYY